MREQRRTTGGGPGGGTELEAHPEAHVAPGKQTLVQLAADAGAPAATVAPAPSGGGQALHAGVQGKMESSFGADFSSVRVHEGDQASQLGARAFAQGNDLHFAPGQYQPETQNGQALIGHELSHVVQQRQGRVAAPVQAKGAPVVADSGLEAEADRHGELAAKGLPVDVGGVADAGGGLGGAIQRKGEAPAEPPAGEVAQQRTFTVPTIPDIGRIPDAVNRNHTINQTYHQIDVAMTGYLGDPLVANWFTFGQHASREAGAQIRNLQMGLEVLRDVQRILLGLAFSVNPIVAVQTAVTATRAFRRILDLMQQDRMVEQVMQLAFAKAGITTTELNELIGDAARAALLAPLPVVGTAFVIRFVARVTDMVAKLIVATPAIIEAVERIYENMKRGNREIYQNVAPAARSFLVAAQGAPNGVPGSMAFDADPSGFLAAAFTEYGQVRRLGDEARAAPGTPEATAKIAQRREKAMRANLLIGFQEQLVILQPIFDTMQEELTAMNGTMVLRDPNGVHPLANNWGDFYSRMGIDPSTAPADPRTITPSTLPPLRPHGQRRGSISSYFEDNVDNEKVHEAPPPIAPG